MLYFGIDFGTNYSSISVLDDDSKEPRICTGKDKEEKTTPSVVWYKADGTVEVGKVAKRNIPLRNKGEEGDPVEIISDFKRHFSEVDFPGYKVKTRNNEIYYPKDVARDILRHMFNLKDVQEELKLEPLYRCAIACPSSYGFAEKQLVMEAAEEAGIKNASLISEPVAAAISYINNTTFKKGRIIIIDLGESSLETSVVDVSYPQLRVVMTHGFNDLGGKDWDRCIFEELKRQYVQNMHTSEEDIDELLAMTLDIASEGIKEDITKDRKFCDDVIGGQDFDFEFVLDQKDFERISERNIEIFLDHLQQTLDIANVESERWGISREIDEVIMVGGSCRMPQIRNSIEEKYPEFRNKLRLFNLDQTISEGAAIYARYITYNS